MGTVYHSLHVWVHFGCMQTTARVTLGKVVVGDWNDQTYSDWEQWTCDLVAFEMAALKAGISSVTICSQSMSLERLWTKEMEKQIK